MCPYKNKGIVFNLSDMAELLNEYSDVLKLSLIAEMCLIDFLVTACDRS